MRTILIATTNEGKHKELSELLKDLPIQCISLNDLGIPIQAPEETESTIEGNAVLKARYYAEKSGYISIADDAGMSIDALQGWPGVHSARIAENEDARIQEVLQKMEHLEDEQSRTAHFESTLAIADPKTNDVFVAKGKTLGSILKIKRGTNGFGYDPIFHVNEVGKTYAEMTPEEKNSTSHRAKAMAGIRRFVINTYGGKHFIVPIGVIVQDGKILINKRNDAEKPELHGLWEFPGGGMEIGETIKENLVREIKEECGYMVEIITQLRLTWTVQIKNPRSSHFGIQIYLLPFVCKIIAGDGKSNDEEVLKSAWVSPEEVEKYDLIGENKKMYDLIYPELIDVITNHKL